MGYQDEPRKPTPSWPGAPGVYTYSCSANWLGGVIVVLSNSGDDARERAVERCKEMGGDVKTLHLESFYRVRGQTEVVYEYNGEY